ncbi:MAG: hypothetical protein AAFX87_05605, partial [Bacteroidota bacterium]
MSSISGSSEWILLICIDGVEGWATGGLMSKTKGCWSFCSSSASVLVSKQTQILRDHKNLFD